MNEDLASILETVEPERLASGFVFTEGPLWHPDGFFYFVDIRSEPSRLYRIRPGSRPETVLADTPQANGTTFDLQGRLLMCEMVSRRVTRRNADGSIEVVADRFEGKRLNRPNDIVCRSDGSIFFTDPALRLSPQERELPDSGVYKVAPDGNITLMANCEFPNGLAFSLDERILYVANSRTMPYIQTIELGPDGSMVRRHIFADLSSDETEGVPDGMKVDVEGRVFCTGAGGIWVFAPDGTKLGMIRTPEVPANLCFGGPDLRTLFFTARTSIYSLQVKTPGLPHPWYAKYRAPTT